MKNPFKVKPGVGYQWWTFSAGVETRDNWGWFKCGPVSFAWGSLAAEDGHRHFEATVLCRWLWRCCRCRPKCETFVKVKADD